MAKQKKKIGIHELYARDPLAADRLLWGREADPQTRRGFLKKSALAAMSMVLGGRMVFAEHFPAGLIPAALAHSDTPFQLPGKHPDLVVLNAARAHAAFQGRAQLEDIDILLAIESALPHRLKRHPLQGSGGEIADLVEQLAEIRSQSATADVGEAGDEEEGSVDMAGKKKP